MVSSLRMKMGQENKTSQVMEFLDNLKENKRAFNEFMSTMHGTFTRNRIPLLQTTVISSNKDSLIQSQCATKDSFATNTEELLAQ
jgi:hypothetical protein